jgi:hypothetical protein
MAVFFIHQNFEQRGHDFFVGFGNMNFILIRIKVLRQKVMKKYLFKKCTDNKNTVF